MPKDLPNQHEEILELEELEMKHEEMSDAEFLKHAKEHGEGENFIKVMESVIARSKQSPYCDATTSTETKDPKATQLQSEEERGITL